MIIALIIISFLLAILFIGLWINETFKEKDSIPAFAHESQQLQVMEVISRELSVPDTFDERRLKADLERFADSPGIFEKYIERARRRFTKEGEVKILEHWIRFYETGTRVVAAKTELGRARSDYQQLSYEDEIKLKKKDVELARLEAEQEEHITRKVRTIKERSRLEVEPVKRSEDDLKVDAAEERNRRDIGFDVRLKAGKKLNTLKELQKWFKRERNAIFNDDDLTSEEQDEQYVQLRSSYNEYKRKLSDDVDIYGED
jgi:hypothetical protein